MIKRFLLASSLILLACTPKNNMAGLDRVYVKPVSLGCVADAVTSLSFVSDFSSQNDVFIFEMEGYRTRMLNKAIDNKLSGYAMTIDGMHKGDEPNAFYKKVKAMETQLFETVTHSCY